MVFSSAVFLFLFLPVTIAIYYNPFFKSMGFKNTWLLLVSLGFYAWGEPVYIALMLLSILMNWIFGLLAASRRPGEFFRRRLSFALIRESLETRGLIKTPKGKTSDFSLWRLAKNG